jgi:endonuclease III
MKSHIDNFFYILKKNNPNPTTDLSYNNHFTLLVAVLLSAQSTDVGVNKATKELFVNFDTPDKFIKLGEENLIDYIKSIGLYKTKAKNIIALCKILIEEYKGRIPDTLEELIMLPGVGRKTANVVLNTAFNVPTIAVDTHIFRVGNRTKFAVGSTPLKVEEAFYKIVPDKYLMNAHNWLIFLGRYICKARKPECWKCPVITYCGYDNKNTLE